MSHLSTERLAALADDAPTPAELAHLASCAGCARERAAYRALVELAATESTRIGEPLTRWDALAPALAADGVIDTGSARTPGRRRAAARWSQAAAAVLLAAAGIGVGRFTAGASMVPALHFGPASSAPSNAPGTATAPSPDALATPVSNAGAASADSAPRFQSVEDARGVEARAQATYQAAMAFLAQTDTVGRSENTPAAVRTRLAALDRVGATMGRALHEAPYDPVINGYYLATMGQREATIRQLDTMLPVGMRITSY
jgi:hypothetical protein